MPFVVYFFVLLITAGSVAFGLDWLHAPMSPMPASKYELRAAKPPEPPKPAVADVKPDVKPEAQPAAKPVAAVTPLPPAPEPAPPSIVTSEPVAAAPPPPKCDVAACEAAYFTFTASDCTYQPSDGPRRLCTKGNPPPSSPAVSQAPSAPAANAQASCNIAACSQAYVSFTSSDCTYQPLDGPRRLCTK